MTALNLKGFSTLVDQSVAAIQGRCKSLIDFSVGSVLRSLVEADAGLALWLQTRVLKVLATTRAATSKGDDLDSFVADFGLTRLGAQASAGVVTFSRFTPGAQAVVPVGAEVQTGDGRQRFAVTLDPSNTSYNAGLGGYVVPVGVSSISLPVAAITPGGGGNVLAGTVSVIASQIDYIDTAINAFDFSGGGEKEGDDALRDRFRLFISSLSKATKTAIGFAGTSQGLGLRYTITEFELYDGSPRSAYFYVVVDDGSGIPPPEIISSTISVIDGVRAAGVSFDVFAPTVTQVSVSMSIVVAQGYVDNIVRGDVATAISNYLEAMNVGDGLPYTKIAQIAYEASAGVTAVNSVLVNGGVADIAPSNKAVIKSGTVTIS